MFITGGTFEGLYFHTEFYLEISKCSSLFHQIFAADDGSLDQYINTCEKHGQPTRRLDGLYILY